MVRLNRRAFALNSAAVAGAVVLGARSTGAFAQDASPAATVEVPVVIGEDGSITITHAQGETTLQGVPSKVATFDIASLDTLDAIGVDITGTAQGQLVGHLDKYNNEPYVNVGTLFEPDYEAVAALEPDLIIVANRSAATYPDLSGIAPTIDLTAVNADDHLASLAANASILGAIFGKDEEVAAALAEINTRVEALQPLAAETGTCLVIMTTGGEVTVLPAHGSAGGRGSFIYNTLGISPVIEDIEEATHGEAVSFEFLLENNPDWLFVIDRDAATGEGGEAAEQVLDNEIVHETTAWQNEQIVYLQPFPWYIAMNGLTVTGLMLDDLEGGFGA